MAFLTVVKRWVRDIWRVELDTRWAGGEEGTANVQAKQLMGNILVLKDYADEVEAARGGKANLNMRLDQYDAFDPESMATLYLASAMGVDLGSLASREIAKTNKQRIQQGVAAIVNRGIITGCTVSKSNSAVRNISIAAGSFFMNGLELPCPAFSNAALVPPNYGDESQYCYAYIFINSTGAVQFACTPLGVAVPEGGLALYRFTVPAGNNEINDAYLASVTMTDVRRVEAGFPIQFNSIAYTSVALPFSMLDAEYEVVIEVMDYKGGWNQRPVVYPGEKAANGFKLFAEGSLDAVTVRWTALKLSL